MSQTAARPQSLQTSQRGRVSPGEWQARVDLAAAHRFMVAKGWQEDYSIYNHLSVRIPGEPDCFLLKPHDLLFSEVTASSLTKCNVNEPKDFKDNINTAGYAIHAGVLKARRDLNSVMHIHTAAGMAVGALDRGLMFITQESMMFYNRIGYHEFEGIAKLDEQERIIRDLGAQNHSLILRNHGLLTCGSSVGLAAIRMGQLITLAEVQLSVLASGEKVKEVAPAVCEETVAQFDSYERYFHTDWNAILRWLDKLDSSYRD